MSRRELELKRQKVERNRIKKARDRRDKRKHLTNTKTKQRQKKRGKKPQRQHKQKKYNLKEAQEKEAVRRLKDRNYRRIIREKQTIERRKKSIVEKYGIEPTISYYYYLCNAVDYVGEKNLRESFKSVQGLNVIVADYSSTDKTKEIAEEYGFKVINVEKTKNIIFHESKLVNAIIHESKSNFLVDLNIHTTYPKNMDKFFRSWIQNNDITQKQLAARGLLTNKNGNTIRRYSASCLFYKPFLIEARGFDERTFYGCGTTPYALSLLLSIYKLVWDDQPLDMIHKFHRNIKFSNLRKMFKIKSLKQSHRFSTEFGETLTDKLIHDFDKGVKKVKNSYW